MLDLEMPILRKWTIVLNVSKSSKMDVSWKSPGVITEKISDLNYTVDIPWKRNNSTVYYVILLKPYHKRPEIVNLIMNEDFEEIEQGAEILYPLDDPNFFDYAKNDSK